jgi:hypothetical protein
MRVRVATIEKRRCDCGWSGDQFVKAGNFTTLCPDCALPTTSTRVEQSQSHFIETDSIPGGLVLENYGAHPIKVYSHTEREKVMASAGLELKEKFCPTPGTDIDPAGIPNPKGYMDPYTLENARILLSRPSQPRHEEPDHVGNIKLEIGATFNEVLSPAEVRKLRETLG